MNPPARFDAATDAVLTRHADLFRRLAEAERAEALRDLPGAGSWEATIDALAEVLTTVLAERDALRVAALPVALLAYSVDNERRCLGAARRRVDKLHDLLPVSPGGDVGLCDLIDEELEAARAERPDLDTIASECAYHLTDLPRSEVAAGVLLFLRRARGQADLELVAARATVEGHQRGAEALFGYMRQIALACGLTEDPAPEDVMERVREQVEARDVRQQAEAAWLPVVRQLIALVGLPEGSGPSEVVARVRELVRAGEGRKDGVR